MRLGASMLVGLLLATSPAGALLSDSRGAADSFGRALTSGNLKALRSVLPEKGKVRLKLIRMGPEDGWYGPSQVEAIFRDFLVEGAVGSFEVLRIDGDDRRYSLVHGRAGITDRTGRAWRVSLHLSFETEADRWVLREIKELRE